MQATIPIVTKGLGTRALHDILSHLDGDHWVWRLTVFECAVDPDSGLDPVEMAQSVNTPGGMRFSWSGLRWVARQITSLADVTLVAYPVGDESVPTLELQWTHEAAELYVWAADADPQAVVALETLVKMLA